MTPTPPDTLSAPVTALVESSSLPTNTLLLTPTPPVTLSVPVTALVVSSSLVNLTVSVARRVPVISQSSVGLSFLIPTLVIL